MDYERNLPNLPGELFALISENLSSYELGRFSILNKRCNELVNNEISRILLNLDKEEITFNPHDQIKLIAIKKCLAFEAPKFLQEKGEKKLQEALDTDNVILFRNLLKLGLKVNQTTREKITNHPSAQGCQYVLTEQEAFLRKFKNGISVEPEELQKFIGFNIEEDSRYAIHYAVFHDNLALAKYLLHHPNVYTNILFLFSKGNIADHLESVGMAKLLLERPDTDVKKATEFDKILLFTLASHTDRETLELLLKHCKINLDYIGDTMAMGSPKALDFWKSHTEKFRKFSAAHTLVSVVFLLARVYGLYMLKSVTALFLNNSSYTNLIIRLCGYACVYFIFFIELIELYCTFFSEFEIHFFNFLERYRIPELQEICFRDRIYLKQQERKIESYIVTLPY